MRRTTLLVFLTLTTPSSADAQQAPSVSLAAAEGAELVGRLRRGGIAMFIRHVDTAGHPCNTFRGGSEGQRNISPAGHSQAAALDEKIAGLGIPVTGPILSGPVFRAPDKAELALAPIGSSSEPVAPGGNRVLVGHRGPIEIIFGPNLLSGRVPEAGALVLEPRGADGAAVLGILEIVPAINGGNPSCGTS